jgi:hypothetical protein
MRRKIFLTAICLALWPLQCESQAFVQDEAHFRKALLDMSTSPYFIFIEVIDARNDERRSFCVEARSLLVALLSELDLGHDQASLSEVVDIALGNTGHVFRFSKQEALDIIGFTEPKLQEGTWWRNIMPVRYTEGDLNYARKLINMFGVAPLMGIKDQQRWKFEYLEWSPALACALIEKGLSARRADITGQIYAEP